MQILYFVVFLGALIFFHELGHYLAARLVGVRVIRFSIGFGPRLVGFRRGDTDYCISAFPLGGYVKFYGDDPDDLPNPEEALKGFLSTTLPRKVFIVVAGPFFNLLLPFVVFFTMHALQNTLVPSVLGDMERSGPAYQAGLRPGDRVLAIDGKPIKYWWELLARVSASPGRPLVFDVERAGQTLRFTVIPKPVEIASFREIGLVETVGRIEVVPDTSRPVVAVRPGSAAWRAGIRDYDAILAADGKDVFYFEEVLAALKEAEKRPVSLTVAQTPVDEAQELGERRDVTIGPLAPGEPLGLEDASMVVADVTAASPAGRAGLKPGDRVLALNGQSVSDWAFLLFALARDPGGSHVLTVQRGSQTLDISVNLQNPRWVPGAAVPKFESLGASVRQAVLPPEEIPNDSRIRYGLYQGFAKTKEAFVVTVAGLIGIISGRVSPRELGGPLMIYDVAAKAGARGLEAFFGAFAWLSMGLGILNLVPIPVLDGGHLVLFGIEAVRRKPLNKRTRERITMAGVVVLLALMAFVFANDIERKWGGLSGQGPAD